MNLKGMRRSTKVVLDKAYTFYSKSGGNGKSITLPRGTLMWFLDLSLNETEARFSGPSNEGFLNYYIAVDEDGNM